jgi:hypothetical protein
MKLLIMQFKVLGASKNRILRNFIIHNLLFIKSSHNTQMKENKICRECRTYMSYIYVLHPTMETVRRTRVVT